MKSIFTVSFLLLFFAASDAQNKGTELKKQFTIISYNVENLFDITDDLQTNDEQFTPGSKKLWDAAKYNKKLLNIAKVISSVNTSELPEIIGLCEIENKKVLEDLIKQPVLAKGKYGIVHRDSPDKRGIETALLYRPDEFKVIKTNTYKISIITNTNFTTRDILYVKGIASKTDTLHIFVNHWTSRMGGVKKSEPKRIEAAKILRSKIDSLLKLNVNNKIIIMGDFNDAPRNTSIKTILQANNIKENKNKLELYNLMYDKDLKDEGSVYYEGRWQMIDNLIVSQYLINSPKGYKIGYDGGMVFKKDWLLTTDKKTGKTELFRTYSSSDYLGGYSDHLPVYMILTK